MKSLKLAKLNNKNMTPRKISYLNVSVGVFTNLIMLCMTLIRVFLINSFLSTSDYGLLSIALSLIPYIASTLTSVTSFAPLYWMDSFNKNDLEKTNAEMSQIQYIWRKRFIYFILQSLFLSLIFPFLIGDFRTGTAWLNALLVFSNTLGTSLMYIILPTELIILTIMQKNYLRQVFATLAVLISNIFIFIYIPLEGIYHFFKITSVWNLIIIALLQGLSNLFVTGIGRLMRQKIIPWYKYDKNVNQVSIEVKNKLRFLLTEAIIAQLVVNTDLIILAIYNNFNVDSFEIAGRYSLYMMGFNAILTMLNMIISAPMYTFASLYIKNDNKIDSNLNSLYEEAGASIGFISALISVPLIPLVASILGSKNEYYDVWISLVVGITIYVQACRGPLENVLSINHAFKWRLKMCYIEAVINTLFSISSIIICSLLSLDINVVIVLLMVSTLLAYLFKYIVSFVYIHKTNYIETHKISFYLKHLALPLLLFVSLAAICSGLMQLFVSLDGFDFLSFNSTWWYVIGIHILILVVALIVSLAISLTIFKNIRKEAYIFSKNVVLKFKQSKL